MSAIISPDPPADSDFDPEERRRQKQASREEDERRLASGEVSREQLRRENGLFVFPSVRLRRPYAR